MEQNEKMSYEEFIKNKVSTELENTKKYFKENNIVWNDVYDSIFMHGANIGILACGLATVATHPDLTELL